MKHTIKELSDSTYRINNTTTRSIIKKKHKINITLLKPKQLAIDKTTTEKNNDDIVKEDLNKTSTFVSCNTNEKEEEVEEYLSKDDRMWNEIMNNVDLSKEIDNSMETIDSDPIFKTKQQEEEWIDSNPVIIEEVKKWKSFPELTQEYLMQQQLPFYVDEETPADGNCFYYALLTKVKSSSIIWNEALLKMEMDPEDNSADYYVQNLNMLSLKAVIIEYMYKFQMENIVCEATVCPNFCEDGLQHLSYLEQVNVWADEFVIRATTALLDSRICLIYPNGKIEKYSWNEQCNTDIYMFYFPQAHFQSVMPIYPEEELRDFQGTYLQKKEESNNWFSVDDERNAEWRAKDSSTDKTNSSKYNNLYENVSDLEKSSDNINNDSINERILVKDDTFMFKEDIEASFDVEEFSRLSQELIDSFLN